MSLLCSQLCGQGKSPSTSCQANSRLSSSCTFCLPGCSPSIGPLLTEGKTQTEQTAARKTAASIQEAHPQALLPKVHPLGPLLRWAAAPERRASMKRWRRPLPAGCRQNRFQRARWQRGPLPCAARLPGSPEVGGGWVEQESTRHGHDRIWHELACMWWRLDTRSTFRSRTRLLEWIILLLAGLGPQVGRPNGLPGACTQQSTVPLARSSADQACQACQDAATSHSPAQRLPPS